MSEGKEKCEFLRKEKELCDRANNIFKKILAARYYKHDVDFNDLENEEHNIWKERVKNKISACNSGKYYNSGEGSFSRKKNV
jgi:hypothetical protein